MSDSIKRVEIFLSSPGDVIERDIAEQVVNNVNNEAEFRDDFKLRLYRWDDEEIVLPMEATDTPQQSVNTYMKKPSDCDLVVVMFWSRMGTPLIMDGREYHSGTHYEYMDGVESRKTHGKPNVWLYRCTRKPTLDMTDPDAMKKLEQFNLVNQFFKGFEDDEGRYTGGVNFYEESKEFADTFGKQLRVYLRNFKINPQTSSTPEPEKPVFEGIPYMGLRAITDETIFFGRERETLETLALIDQQRIVFLIGASGSGKSSLASAGIMPRLQRRKGWQVIRFTPSNDPYLSLAKALVTDLDELDIAPLDRLDKVQDLADKFRTDAEYLKNTLEMLTDDTVLLFIDQFEELFTLNHDDTQSSFAELLKVDAPQIRILATMRADFYERATPYFEKQLRQNYTLAKPSPFALYEMVTEPAKLANLTFDAGLAEQIVTELGNDSGALALMAYLLEQLYLKASQRGDNTLIQQDYDELGGVQQAIGTYAEQIYNQLLPDYDDLEQQIQAIFTQLITVDERGTATRQQAKLSLFDDAQQTLIQAFVDARLLVTNNGLIEVAHEAILREWTLLVDWIEATQDDHRMINRMKRESQIWHERGEPEHLRPNAETLAEFTSACDKLNIQIDDPILEKFTEPEQERLYRELEIIETIHERRRDIGDRLAVIGDTRKGIGVKDGLPDIEWLFVNGSDGENISFKNQDAYQLFESKISDFYISKYTITQVQYLAFAESEYNNSVWWEEFPNEYKPQELYNQRTSNINAPRDTISWYQSVAFSRWLNVKLRDANRLPNPEMQVRLPTEWEWQWVAMNGKENREYPWGTLRSNITNSKEAGLSRTVAVGMYPNGKSECGALDLSGNIWEWCLNNYRNTELVDDFSSNQSKILRGGSFYNSITKGEYRYSDAPYRAGHRYGIRLVLSSK